MASTAALPRGPGVLRDVTDGASGGVQVQLKAASWMVCPDKTAKDDALLARYGLCRAMLRSNPHSDSRHGTASQGLGWYKAKLKQDADGDVAEQFWSEVQGQTTAGGKPKGQPKRPLEVHPASLTSIFSATVRLHQRSQELHGRVVLHHAQ